MLHDMSADVPLAARLSASSFTHPVERLQRRETAISWLVMTGQYVYKIKKPVHLDYLDASTLERRHFLCEEELRLNRRFAPQLYLEVVPIAQAGGIPRVGDATAPPVEYAVRMRQFPASEELAHRLNAGTVSEQDMADFGARLSAWHAAAVVAREPDHGSLALVRTQLLQNLSSLSVHADAAHGPPLQHLAGWTRTQLERSAALIESRHNDGYVRECHGDLHAGNVVHWQGQWLPFDCLEFEPRLRFIDVMSDVAFLFMDLGSRGRRDLAFAFLSAYLEGSGDYAGLPLLPLYGVYRALVRAKVDALAGDHERQQQRIAAAQALSHSRAPAVILMHGLSGSGKSWLSSRLGPAIGAVRVRSDLERRRLLGARAHSEAADARTYQRLYDCCASALDAGLPIIVDATFLERERRQPFIELARHRACPLLLIDCRASEALLAERIAKRSREAHDPSEADAAVLQAQLSRSQPLEPAEYPSVVTVDTGSAQALEHTLQAVFARLHRPSG